MRPDIDPARRAFCGALLTTPWLLARAEAAARVPVLVYHRFGATQADSMTVRTSTFESHLRTLQELDAQVIALDELVAYRLGERAELPPRAVVLTADDGHRSQFELMAPMLKPLAWPLTLFIYPSAISNASYAMTWAQLQALAERPGFTVQSHTYWHPNFLKERQRQSAEAFQAFAQNQLRKSRDTLQSRLGKPISLLAWPFGLSDPPLWEQAKACGYRAAFSLGNRAVTLQDPLFALPRHLMVDSVNERTLAALLSSAFKPTTKATA